MKELGITAWCVGTHYILGKRLVEAHRAAAPAVRHHPAETHIAWELQA